MVKIHDRWLILIFFFLFGTLLITVWGPILLFISGNFSICLFLECIKEYTFPFWLCIFSGFWIYFKNIVSSSKHSQILIEKIDLDNCVSAEIRQMEYKKYQSLNEKIRKANIAEKEILSLEKLFVWCTLFIGMAGIVRFLVCD